MSTVKYTCPPQSATGSGTFSDNLVGFQLVDGGGLTQGNFNFTESFSEKSNRTFNTGTFSDPISLDTMNMESLSHAKAIIEKNYSVYPNFDLTNVVNFTLYGSLTKRMSTSIQKILAFFPASLDINALSYNYSSGYTASNIIYNVSENKTTFDVNTNQINNPFDIDYSVNATRNLSLREIEVSDLRNFTVNYRKYIIYYGGNSYDIIILRPSQSLTNDKITITVIGNPFSGMSNTYENFIIRPNDYYVNNVFSQDFDEVEKFILNRLITPIYTATFQVPTEAEDGTYFIQNQQITWPLNGTWNLDIITNSFTTYINNLYTITDNFDTYKTNLISRFLVTGAIKEFDTEGQKVEKVLQLYGRSFDETKKFIDALAYMNSVNYNVGNDIPSQLLKNLSETLGWKVNISPISNDELLQSVFGTPQNQAPNYSGYSRSLTPDEINYQYYRNLVLNSAYLFKSKGTRKSIEILMRLIGAPESLIEFNEYVYLADGRVNINQFNQQYAQISGGTYAQELPVLEKNNIFSIHGQTFTGFTTTTIYSSVNLSRTDYPVDDFGYPQMADPTTNYFFQIGSGWFESTPQHRSPLEVDVANSTFTGYNPNYQTKLQPFNYGQKYLDRYRNFPYMSLGYQLYPKIDNKKSWTDTQLKLRNSVDAGFDARYYTENDKLVLNVKNVDIFLNPSQGMVYDVWSMSVNYDYPIPNTGLTTPYPKPFGVDWTEINPQPKSKTFFEFAQTFWHNMINVRDRQFNTDGKTSGYPTLQSIWWKYIESENCPINIPNDNFNYQTLIDYVNGLGDYWIRLVEQMVPATTIWNTGVKLENSIFHRQKFVWRRQDGCNLIALPCTNCFANGTLYSVDCLVSSIKCGIYPWNNNATLNNFNAVLGLLLNNYLTSIGKTINDCDLSTMTSEWFVELNLDGSVISKTSFFNGVGFTTVYSYPTSSQWLTALETDLNNTLNSYSLSYFFDDDGNLVVYTLDCTGNKNGLNFKINVGINFNISCL
jgi:hypothetical protein